MIPEQLPTIVDYDDSCLDADGIAHCRMALAAQSACNSSGVAFSLRAWVKYVCNECNAHNRGTAWKNRHPLIVATADKLLSLARVQTGVDDYTADCYAWLEKRAATSTAA